MTDSGRKRRRANWVLLVLGTLIGGSAIQAFIPECGIVVAGVVVGSGICNPALIYFATGAVAVVAIATEVVLGSRDTAGRPCPACNTQVPTGRTRCEACGYDFAAAP